MKAGSICLSHSPGHRTDIQTFFGMRSCLITAWGDTGSLECGGSLYLSSEFPGIHVKHPNCKRSVFAVVFGDLDLQRLLSPTVQFCLWGHSLAPTDAFINVHGTKAAFSVESSAFPEEGSSLARGRGMEAQAEVQTYTLCLFKCIIPACFATNQLCFIKRHNRSLKCGWLFPLFL